jgi:hypothetical protein
VPVLSVAIYLDLRLDRMDEALAGTVAATDPASASANYDNGRAALHG